MLWTTSLLLVMLSAGILVPAFSLEWPAALTAVGFIILSIAALLLLTMMFVTLKNADAYEWDADFSTLPTLIRWPLRFAWWVGTVFLVIANIAFIFTTNSTSIPAANARFAMSLLAAIGAFLALFPMKVIPGIPTTTLLIGWLTIIAIAILRGAYGIIARIIRWTRRR